MLRTTLRLVSLLLITLLLVLGLLAVLRPVLPASAGAHLAYIDPSGRRLMLYDPARGLSADLTPGLRELLGISIGLRQLESSPELRRLVFLNDRLSADTAYTDTDLIVYDLDVRRAHALDYNGPYAAALALSPDGRRLAYMQPLEAGSAVVIWELGAPSGTRALRMLPVVSAPYSFELTWAPDSQRLAFVSNADGIQRRDLAILDTQTGAARRVTFGLRVVHAVWSPDGTQMLLLAWPDDDPAQMAQLYRVYLRMLDRDTRDPVRSVIDAGLPYTPVAAVWSPDGAMLAVQGLSPNASRYGLWSLPLRYPYTGAQVGPHTRLSQVPCWSPDGRWLTTLLESPNTLRRSWQAVLDLHTGRTQRVFLRFDYSPTELAWIAGG